MFMDIGKIYASYTTKLSVTRSSPFLQINPDVIVNSHIRLSCCKWLWDNFSKIITRLQPEPSSDYSVNSYLVLVSICSGLTDLFRL